MEHVSTRMVGNAPRRRLHVPRDLRSWSCHLRSVLSFVNERIVRNERTNWFHHDGPYVDVICGLAVRHCSDMSSIPPPPPVLTRYVHYTRAMIISKISKKWPIHWCKPFNEHDQCMSPSSSLFHHIYPLNWILIYDAHLYIILRLCKGTMTAINILLASIVVYEPAGFFLVTCLPCWTLNHSVESCENARA